MNDAQHETDIGQQMTEEAWSNADVARKQFQKQLKALCRDYSARLAAVKGKEWHVLYDQYMEEVHAWIAENEVPQPGPRPIPGPVVYKPLALVGRGDNRSGPMTDG